jgi:hypothetical protein
MTCDRLTCGRPATWRLIITTMSGRRKINDLCDEHVARTYDWAVRSSAVRSAWKTPKENTP